MNTPPVVIETAAVRYRYPGAQVDAVAGIELSVRGGEFVALLGPNGSGKTTLLRMLAGAVPAAAGTVRIMDRAVEDWRRRDLATAVAVVAQREEPAFPQTVYQTVMLGRYPHLGPFRSPGRVDRAEVDAALARCDVASLTPRWIGTLSGGEWQRVRIARALAQQPRILMLDEATASLDVRHEMEVYGLVASLVKERGLAGLVVTHDVNLAARFADRVVVMHQGRAAGIGPPSAVLTPELFTTVFEWPVAVTAWEGIPQFVPLTVTDRSGGTDS